MTKATTKLNSCSKTKEKSSSKPRKSMSMISTINEKWESNSKTNSSNSKISSVEKTLPSVNSNSKLTISSTKTKTSLSKTKDSKANLWEWKKFTVAKSTNLKPLSTSKPEILSKLLFSTILSSKSSKRKDSNTLSNWLSSLKEKLRICKKNSRLHKTPKEYFFH